MLAFCGTVDHDAAMLGNRQTNRPNGPERAQGRAGRLGQAANAVADQ